MEVNKIYNEDCMETMRRMPDAFIDMVLTSPPYDNLRTYNNDIDKTWGDHIWQSIISELYRVTKEGGVVVWNVNDATVNGSKTGTSFRQCLYAKDIGFNIHDVMIWNKGGFTAPCSNRYPMCYEYLFVWSKKSVKTFNPIKDRPNVKPRSATGTKRKTDGSMVKTIFNYGDTGIRFNIFNIPGEQSSVERSGHPAQMSLDLSKDLIYSWSNESDLIYDPFMGSGTTAKAAHILNRNWIGSEISSEYCDIANKRIDSVRNQLRMF